MHFSVRSGHFLGLQAKFSRAARCLLFVLLLATLLAGSVCNSSLIAGDGEEAKASKEGHRSM